MAKTSTGKRARRNQLREKAAKKRKQQSMLLWGSITAVVAVVALIIFAGYWSQRAVGDEQAFAGQGNVHIPDNTRSTAVYNSTPPTSGPHYESIARWGVYEEALPYERILHNLEDGGVAVYYQCEDGCPEIIAALSEVVQPLIDRGRHVIMAPNDPSVNAADGLPLHRDMGATVALAAWQRLAKFDEVDVERITEFIERYEGIDHHQ